MKMSAFYEESVESLQKEGLAEKELEVEPFITSNNPRYTQLLNRWTFEAPFVCSYINQYDIKFYFQSKLIKSPVTW